MDAATIATSSIQPEQAMISLDEMKALLYISMPGGARLAADKAEQPKDPISDIVAMTNWERHKVDLVA